MAKHNNTFDPSKPPADARLYTGDMSAGDRIKAASFDSSEILGTDGKFLGMPVSNGMAGALNFMVNQGLPFAVDHISDHATQVTQNFARNYLGHDPKAALEFGKTYGKALPYAVVFAKPIIETASAAYSMSGRLGELNQAAAPVLKANGQSSLGAGIFSDVNNEVIHNARAKIFTAAKNDLLGTAASSVALIPSFMIAHRKEQAKLETNMKDAELSYLKEHGTPEQLAEYRRERLRSTMTATNDGRKLLNEQLREEKEIYEKGFKEFKQKQSSKFRKAFEKASEGNNKKDGTRSEAYVEFVTDLGLRPNALESEVKTKWLQQRYAEENGAWNEKWLPPQERQRRGWGRKDDQPKTHEEMIKAEFQKELDRMNESFSGETGKKSSSSKDGEMMMSQTLQAMATLGGETLRGFVGKDTNKDLKSEIALDMILDTKRAMDENSQRTTIPGGKNDSEQYTVAQMVHRIFQQHQHDCGQAEIGARDIRSMKAVNWDDADIQKMKDSDLNAYEVAVKHISQYIRDGRMDPLALINLVGERKIVMPGGKSFGTLKSNDAEAVKENVIAEIDHQAALLRPQHKMGQDEVSAALANYTFTKEELQAAFSNHGMRPDEKAFLFMILDTSTPDDAVLKDLTGRSDTEIKQLRQDAQKHFSVQFDAALREMAEDLASNPAAIERYNLTEEEAMRFQDVYRKAQQTGGSIGDVLEGEARKEVAASVANTLVDDALHHDGKLWSQRIRPHAERTIAQNKEEGQAKQAEKAAIKAQSFADAEAKDASGFADRISSPPQAMNDNGYLDSQPFVSQPMQQGYQQPASFADRARPVAGTYDRGQTL